MSHISEIIKNIKLSIVLIVVLFIFSTNMWFLTIYFFDNPFYKIQELIIIILLSVSISLIWNVITYFFVLKLFINSILNNNDKLQLLEFGNNESMKSVNMYVLLNSIINHFVLIIVLMLLKLFFEVNLWWFVSVSMFLYLMVFFFVEIKVFSKIEKFRKEGLQ